MFWSKMQYRLLSITKFVFGGFICVALLILCVAANDNDIQSPCRLWLGPSYLASDSNYKIGLYAGIEYNKDDLLPSYEVGFPLYDFLQNPAKKISSKHRATIEYLESMMWTSDYAGTARWEANSSSTIFVPGIGIIPNYHTGIYNVDWFQSSVLNREPYIPSRQATASRGAISPYYNFSIRATRSIPAGMELFAKYSDLWDEQNQNVDNEIYQDTIKRPDYELADELVDKILDFFNKFEGEMSAEVRDDVFEFMLGKILSGNAGKRDKIYRSIIPNHLPKLKKVKEAGGTFQYRYNDMIRSPQWLEEHALCVDNLDVRPSTIAHAGRGAFAKRSFKEGDIISPVPMIPIPTEEVLHLYKPVEKTKKNGDVEITFDTKEPIGFQLILNYLYGHPESTLHLMPSAPAVNFINHGTLGSVNAYMEWSTHDYVYNDHMLHDKHLSGWEISEVPSIVMNLIAARDISPGEEILIDYGEDWERSWMAHLVRWKKKYNETGIPQKWPLKAQDTIALYDDKPYPVSIKEDMTPYPDGVVTGCYLFDGPAEVADGEPRLNDQGQDIYVWKGPDSKQDLVGQGLTICDILDRRAIFADDDDSRIVDHEYTVLTRLKEGKRSNLAEVQKVPHFAIALIDRPYTSDIHTPGAFRHWIGIDDAMFPQAWRNLRD